MAETFALLASLCFATSHILIRRGLAKSNAITGSFISLALTAITLWILVPFFVPLSSFGTPALWYFITGGIFAPGLGRILAYHGIERIGVARSVPLINTSPIFASLIAVFLLRESWTLQNVFGTSFVILGIVVLSTSRTERGQWRKVDLIYPLLSALSFAISSNLRKFGLVIANLPFMAAAVTSTTALLLAVALLYSQGGPKRLAASRQSFGWLFAAGIANTGSMLCIFYALSFGKVVIVEPLVSTNPVLTVLFSAIFLRDLEAITSRIVLGMLCTVVGTVLVVTV